MDYSSLILMEKEKDTGFIKREAGSFEVNEGARYIKSFYVQGETVYIKFDTDKDVEEWQYSAIYDYFDYETFKNNGFEIQDIDEEYNPTFILEFEYKDDFEYIKSKLDLAIELIEETMGKVFNDIEGKEEEYN